MLMVGLAESAPNRVAGGYYTPAPKTARMRVRTGRFLRILKDHQEMVTSNAGYVTNRRDPFSRSGAVGVVEASTRFDPAVAFVIWDVPRVRFHDSVRHGSAMGCCAAQSWLTAAFRPRVTAVGHMQP
jgi:hypothetical protein